MLFAVPFIGFSLLFFTLMTLLISYYISTAENMYVKLYTNKYKHNIIMRNRNRALMMNTNMV